MWCVYTVHKHVHAHGPKPIHHTSFETASTLNLQTNPPKKKKHTKKNKIQPEPSTMKMIHNDSMRILFDAPSKGATILPERTFEDDFPFR